MGLLMKLLGGGIDQPNVSTPINDAIEAARLNGERISYQEAEKRAKEAERDRRAGTRESRGREAMQRRRAGCHGQAGSKWLAETMEDYHGQGSGDPWVR